MSTQPTGWQQPKTNWQAADAVTPADINRSEGNAAAIETGNRTVDPVQAPASNVGTLRQLVDWFANRIKAITGTVNWWDTPPTTLTAAKAHIDAAAGAHAATAIAYAGSAGLQSVNVETALDELDTEKLRLDGSAAMTGKLNTPGLVVRDTRDTAPGPDVYSKEWNVSFKKIADVSLGGIAGGTYCTVVGIKGWSDESGGRAHQIAYTDDGIFTRTSVSATGWGPWDKSSDAETVGGLQPNNLMAIRGSVLATDNLNNFFNIGVFSTGEMAAVANRPPVAMDWSVLEVFKAGNGYTVQRLTQSTSGECWERTRTETTWTAWQKVMKSVGGTFTGSITAPGVVSTSNNMTVDSAGNVHYWLKNGGANRGLLYYDANQRTINMRVYAADGSNDSISIDEAGVAKINGEAIATQKYAVAVAIALGS